MSAAAYIRYVDGCARDGDTPVSPATWDALAAALPSMPSGVRADLTATTVPPGRGRTGPVRPRRPRSTRVIEATDYAAMMERMIRAHGRRVADCDVEDLADLIALGPVLDEAIAYAVREMRARHGRSWSDIARGAGVTRQSAHERWGQR
jgi:hypothetical protein